MALDGTRLHDSPLDLMQSSFTFSHGQLAVFVDKTLNHPPDLTNGRATAHLASARLLQTQKVLSI